MSSTRAIGDVLVLLVASGVGAVEWPTHAGVRDALRAWIAAGAPNDCP